MKLLIMNGPNLNLLGQREKDIYGERSFDSYLQELKGMFPEVELDYFQSNVEGELINRIHEARGVYSDLWWFDCAHFFRTGQPVFLCKN